jgi:nicotinate-nucleotide adenylyltransferase
MITVRCSMRTAFFGGSFDPPHRGHVAIALAAADRLNLDRVLVAPVGRQPLKDGMAMAGYPDRLAMVALAFAADARCAASSLDAPKADGRYNYTYDTLAALKQTLQEQDRDARLFCLLGADSFHTLIHWHRAAELILLCDFAIATRPGYSLASVGSRLPENVRIAGRHDTPGCIDMQLQSLADGASTSMLHILTDLQEDVSATALRNALASGDTAASGPMLAESVADYICEHRLYDAAPHC